jgi:putative nucleotidyltransferase with HDIG domain
VAGRVCLTIPGGNIGWQEVKMKTEQRVRVELLLPGVFVRLGQVWFKHPFVFNQFKLKSWDQIDTLKQIGIKEVFWVPEKSDCFPREGEPGMADLQPTSGKKGDPYVELLWRIKKERQARLKEKHKKLNQCAREYERTMKSFPALMAKMLAGSDEAFASAEEVVEGMTTFFLGDTDALVHMINIKENEESIYYHSINVSVLALMLGRKVRLAPSEMHVLGMGALFHDIGKNRIDKKVLRKAGPLTKAEMDLIQLHPQYGVDILTQVGVPDGVLRVVLEHHEQYDGQGYPSGLEGEKISKLARIVRIVDYYDNLCNNPDPEKRMTPYEALSYMYSKRHRHLDLDIFTEFIRSMGIYPPGTVVQLSNGDIGIVVSINHENPMKPALVIYDPDVPRAEALIFDMDDDLDITIEKSIRAENLTDEIQLYLAPTRRVNYFMEKGKEKN